MDKAQKNLNSIFLILQQDIKKIENYRENLN
jgi:hypothetical protein